MSIRFVDLYPDEDQARLDELDARAKAAKKKVQAGQPRLMHEADEWIDAATERDELAASLESKRIRVAMRHQPRRRWRALMAEHVARDGNEDDKVFGVNIETLPDALIPISIDREKSENLPDDIDSWLESLSDVDFYDRLFLAAYGANRGGAGADPKARLLSQDSPTSDETSS